MESRYRKQGHSLPSHHKWDSPPSHHRPSLIHQRSHLLPYPSNHDRNCRSDHFVSHFSSPQYYQRHFSFPRHDRRHSSPTHHHQRHSSPSHHHWSPTHYHQRHSSPSHHHQEHLSPSHHHRRHSSPTHYYQRHSSPSHHHWSPTHYHQRPSHHHWSPSHHHWRHSSPTRYYQKRHSSPSHHHQRHTSPSFNHRGHLSHSNHLQVNHQKHFSPPPHHQGPSLDHQRHFSPPHHQSPPIDHQRHFSPPPHHQGPSLDHQRHFSPSYHCQNPSLDHWEHFPPPHQQRSSLDHQRHFSPSHPHQDHCSSLYPKHDIQLSSSTPCAMQIDLPKSVPPTLRRPIPDVDKIKAKSFKEVFGKEIALQKSRLKPCKKNPAKGDTAVAQVKKAKVKANPTKATCQKDVQRKKRKLDNKEEISSPVIESSPVKDDSTFMKDLSVVSLEGKNTPSSNIQSTSLVPFMSTLKRSSRGRIVKPVLSRVIERYNLSAATTYSYSYNGEFEGLKTLAVIDLTVDDDVEKKSSVKVNRVAIKTETDLGKCEAPKSLSGVQKVKTSKEVALAKNDFSKKSGVQNKKRVCFQSDESETDEWNEATLKKLKEVVYSTPAITADFWGEVSRQMKRPADLCFKYYRGESPPPRKKKIAKEEAVKMEDGSHVITGKAGTLKRRKQLRLVLNNIMSNCSADDAFDSTPLSKRLKSAESYQCLDGSYIEKKEESRHYESPVSYKHTLGATPVTSSPLSSPFDFLCTPNMEKKRQNADLLVHRYQKTKPSQKVKEPIKPHVKISKNNSIVSRKPPNNVTSECLNETSSQFETADVSKDEDWLVDNSFNNTSIIDLEKEYQQIISQLDL